MADEAAAVKRAARRAGCRLRSLRRKGPRLVGELACDDGWAAARLLLALAEEDARTPGARALAAQIRGGQDDETFARALHAYVKEHVRFEPEEGEVFQSGAFTLTNGVGDCDCHFRLLYGLAHAGGLPGALGVLHRGQSAPADKQGPAHAAVILCPRGQPCAWAETTVDAEYGESPNDAAARLGLHRTDIAKEVVIMSTDTDLPPPPDGFRGRQSARQVLLDAEALRRLGYLARDAFGDFCDPTDPVLRRAVLAFQLAHNLHPDALLGDRETRPAIAAALQSAAPEVTEGFHYSFGGAPPSAPATTIGEVAATKLTADLSDEFLRDVIAMATRFRARGATASAEDFLLVWLSESGIRNIPNVAGAPFGGLNQMGPQERANAGFRGTFADWLTLSLVDQLPFVERYYVSAAAGHDERYRDATSLYVANFAPGLLAHADDPDFALYRSPSQAYNGNRQLDVKHKGYISVDDLRLALERASGQARWTEVRARIRAMGGGSSGSTTSSVARTVAGVLMVVGLVGGVVAARHYGWV